KNLPSLLDINPFHLPSEHNTRSFHHAQQYHPNQQHHQHLPNINIPPMRPAYLNPKPAPRTIPPTYQHLTQQVQRKPA
ncbi:unnamed protein product, partial [Rotaria sp. Silwood1]